MTFQEQLEQAGWTQERLADELGLGQPSVSKWGRRGVPAERVLDVERITGISRHELRPDLYPRAA